MQRAVGQEDEPTVGDKQNARYVALVVGKSGEDAFDYLSSRDLGGVHNLLAPQQIRLEQFLYFILLASYFLFLLVLAAAAFVS